MDYVLYSLSVLLMIVMPLALGTMIARQRPVTWDLFGIGAATFVGAQLFHLPFNWAVEKLELLPQLDSTVRTLVVVALFAGLSAGFFEEVARYVAYRYWAKEARTWGASLMLGAGHGGVEAILLALLLAANLTFLFGIRGDYFTKLIPAEQLSLVQSQAEGLFAVPGYQALLPALERLFALCAHLALSLLVMQVFTRQQWRWLLAAVGWHALLDALALFGAVRWSVLAAEAVVGLVALLSLGIVFLLYEPAATTVAPDPLPAPEPVARLRVEPTAEELEQSRYHG